MFADLKLVVDLVRAGVSSARRRRSEKTREQAALDLLRVYFLLKNCVDEGARVVGEAGPDPVATLSGMKAEQADAVLQDWDEALNRQGVRLRALRDLVFGHAVLAFVGPEVLARIENVVGSKMNRVNSLHAIGATLYIRCVLPTEKSVDDTVGRVALMAGSESEHLDSARINAEVESLRTSLDEYRGLVDKLLSRDEIVRLAKRAQEKSV